MILNIRIDHKTAEISQMEQLNQHMEGIFQEINQNHSVNEYLQIKTCNRQEMYLVIDKCDLNYHWGDLVVKKDDEALEHVLRLASGLESMIVGEDQILGQLRDAQKQAIKAGSCGPILNNVFTKAIHVGQLVRKKTHINEGAVSIGSAAVRLAEHVHGDLKCKKVLVIGAGQMGTLVAKALVVKRPKAIVVANRTHDRALCLAKELGGSAIYFDRLAEALYDADVVISATGAPHPIITYEKLKEAVPVETLGKMVMVDIANPRDIDERVAELGVRLYNIDDLRGIARENLQMRENEAKAAEAIIGEELVLLRRSLKHLEVEPLISSIRNQAEKMRIKETKKALRMMGDINGQEKVVDDLSRVVVDRIFSGIIKNIKIAAEKDDKSTLEVVERLFSNG